MVEKGWFLKSTTKVDGLLGIRKKEIDRLIGWEDWTGLLDSDLKMLSILSMGGWRDGCWGEGVVVMVMVVMVVGSIVPVRWLTQVFTTSI